MITHFNDYALGSVSFLSLLQLQSQLVLPVSLLILLEKLCSSLNSVSDSGLLSYGACFRDTEYVHPNEFS